jgi:enterochelin esterase-like enzyme
LTAVFLLVLATVAAAIFLFGGRRGKVMAAEYTSAGDGQRLRMLVYLPPDYPRDAPYPVLYLLHGAGDDETSWQKEGAVDGVLDRLHAGKKIVPMIVVMPGEPGRGTAMERDLLAAVVPDVESHYNVRNDRQGRAIAGVSLGGGQALSIGLKHADQFAWIGAFSPALVGTSENELVANLAEQSGQLKLLWISCGKTDRLKEACQSLHRTLEEKKFPHVWYVGPGGHEERRNDLREFAPLLFR